MSQLPPDGCAPLADAAGGDSDAPQAEVGGGRREPAREGPLAEARGRPVEMAGEGPVEMAGEGRMAAVAGLMQEPAEEEGPESRPRARPRNGPGTLPHFHLRHPLRLLGVNYQQYLRRFLENYRAGPGRLQELEGRRRRRFAEALRARQAAFAAGDLRNARRMDFDPLTFTIALTASEVINPLIEELGCDKFINRG
ncbi:EP300-interacting inhibitor of differentiation 2 [Echinops telfairi]|uniref:EP300-interacting inhibitor of differentiation 2 n=1 Tax=Echinops telfairi TaxID=9371 RepID=A0ABM0ZSA6_ECHTE|nr:EP300-interacting inhibitor of differentiation 2 [Echinops telfairi]